MQSPLPVDVSTHGLAAKIAPSPLAPVAMGVFLPCTRALWHTVVRILAVPEKHFCMRRPASFIALDGLYRNVYIHKLHYL
jgi:hypothetical protein